MTAPTAQEINRNRELTLAAVAELLTMPPQIREAEMLVAELSIQLREAKHTLAEAESDAEINCNADGKNAEARKLQLQKAVNDSPDVQTAHSRIAALEAQLATAEVDFKSLHRRFQAGLALADLQAAQIRYLATMRLPNGHNS